MRTCKSGISLIVLVITIIVLSILAATVIVDLDNTNIIGQASDTVFRSDMSNYKELFQTYIANKRAENPKFDRDSLNVTSSDAEYTEIFGDNVKDEYKEKLQVKNGKLVYNTVNAEEAELVKDVGILVIAPISEIAIGDLIEYTSTADPKKEYAGATYTTKDADGYYIESETKYTPGTLKWVYLGQDENGNTLLTSQEATSFNVTLAGQDGFVTGPDRLDTLCNTLYGNSTYGEARNMKIEDVHRVIEYDGPLGTYYDASGTEVTTATAMTMGALETELGITLRFRTPPRLSTTAVEDYLSDYLYYNAITYIEDTTNEYKVIFRNADGTTDQTTYWLSSSCALLSNGSVAFCLRSVTSGGLVDGWSFGYSNGDDYDELYSYALRPVIVLKSNIQFGEKNADGEWKLVEL